MRTDDPEFWNLMFANDDYVFGEEPNLYMKQHLADLSPGKVLLPGDGEGRNAVYCAQKGWQVSAFDLSTTGKTKAEALAEKQGVEIDFRVGDVTDMHYPKTSFDALVLIFAHFMPEKRRAYHRSLADALKPGGKLILEGHARAGEPVDMRFNLEEVKTDFSRFRFLEAHQKMATLQEGQMIRGKTHVVQIFAEKI